MRKITVGNYDYDEIVLPSKINSLTIGQLDYMYQVKTEIPLLPNGISYRPQRNIFVVQKKLNSKLVYIGWSRNFISALEMLISFCEKHKLKV